MALMGSSLDKDEIVHNKQLQFVLVTAQILLLGLFFLTDVVINVPNKIRNKLTNSFRMQGKKKNTILLPSNARRTQRRTRIPVRFGHMVIVKTRSGTNYEKLAIRDWAKSN